MYTHLVSVLQRCVTRDFFEPNGSIRNKQQRTLARTPRTATAACSTDTEDTNREPAVESDCQVLQEEKMKFKL